MFLIIFETGEIGKLDFILDEDYRSCNDGYCDLLDISDSENPLQYTYGKWEPIENIGEM